MSEAAAAADGQDRPVIHVMSQGNLANRMIQLLVAANISARVPGCLISNVSIPEWNIDLPALPFRGERIASVDWHRVEVDALAQALGEDRLDGVVFSGYGQRIENLPPLEAARRLFDGSGIAIEGYGPEHLVINVRAGEILSGQWDHYTLVPIEFYAELIERSGLRPVFMGQIGDDPYCSALRARFPQAEFRSSGGALADFELIRRSANIVLSVSTFSWLAAWLSAASLIVVPMTGFLNPFQDRDVDLAPHDDPRYRWMLFPINYAAPVAMLEAAHGPLRGLWRLVSPATVARLKQEAPRLGEVTLADEARLFDEAFYLDANPDVAEAVRRGFRDSGFAHYVSNGRGEGRNPFRFDRVWYSRQYPLAAIEVGQGDYNSLRDHYVRIGRSRGYRPFG